MADNFFAYMYGANKKDEVPPDKAAEKPVGDETVVQDEAIGPWTHKYTVYCSNPSETFIEELKAKDGVVAVYMKEKEEKPVSAENTPPNNN